MNSLLTAIERFYTGVFSFFKTLWDWLSNFPTLLFDVFHYFFSGLDDFILDWGDWLVSWIWTVVIALLNFIIGMWIWRFLTFTFTAAIFAQARLLVSTGFMVYMLSWFTTSVMRSAGVTILTYGAWTTGFIPDVKSSIDSVVSQIPSTFMPMVYYFNIPEAIHFIFSLFIFVATYKVAVWVFKPPLNLFS